MRVQVQVQVGILVLVWLLFLPVVYFYIKHRIETGRGTFTMVVLALVLVCAPVLPIPDALRDYTLFIYVPWVIGFSIACVLLVSTRRVIVTRSPGHDLPESRWDIMPIVAKVVVNILQYSLIVTWALSTVVYGLAMVSGMYNPFGMPFSIGESTLFHVNQALKGMLFDLMEVFELNVQTKLHLRAVEHPIYGGVLVIYRLFCSTVVIGAVGLMLLRYLGGKKSGQHSHGE